MAAGPYLSVAITLLCVSLLPTGQACMSADPNAGGTTGTPSPTQATPPPEETTEAPTEAPTTAAGAADDKACQTLGADFGNSDKGQWQVDNQPGDPKWDLHDASKRRGSKTTGVPNAFDGKGHFLAADLNKNGDMAAVQSGDIPDDVKFDKQQYLLVRYYEAIDGAALYGCHDDTSEANCSPISNKKVTNNDLRWQQGSYPIPAGTKKVFLVAKDEGENKGSVGIDKVGLVDDPNGPDKCAGAKAAPTAAGGSPSSPARRSRVFNQRRQ